MKKSSPRQKGPEVHDTDLVFDNVDIMALVDAGDDSDGRAKRNAWNTIRKPSSVRGVKVFKGRTSVAGRPKTEVRWKQYTSLKKIVTRWTQRDYDKSSPTWGEMVETVREWTVKIYRTSNKDVGELHIYGPLHHIPQGKELGYVQFELAKLGLHTTRMVENVGSVFRGPPCEFDGYAEDDPVEYAARWKYHYEKSVAHVRGPIETRYSKWYPKGATLPDGKVSNGRMWLKVSKDFIDGLVAKAMAKPRENPLNLYGWGVRINKGMDNERYVIRLGGTKYRADKKTSGKRSKGGGGRAYRVGSASSVQREVGRHLDARLSDQGYDTSRVERIAALAKVARGMENLIHK